MALIRVREKSPVDATEPQVTYVDEAWLQRWPDDFEEVPEPEPAGAAPTEPTITEPGKPTVDAPAGDEPPARGRF